MILGAVLFAATLTLPQVKSVQDATYHGPAVPYYNGTDSLSGYYVPPVEEGTPLNFTFSNFIPGKVEVSIFSTNPGDISPVEGILPYFVKTLVTNSTITFRAPQTGPYGVYVISYDNTTYVLRVVAVYSPYFWLAEYSFAGVVIVFASAIVFYYYTFASKRWARDREAVGQAAGSG